MQKDFCLDPFFDGLHHVHDKVKLSVCEQDSVTYFAMNPFTITEFLEKKEKDDMEPAQQPVASAPHPFERSLDAPWEARCGSFGLWRVNSGPAREEAVGHCYEMIFQHGTSKSPAAVAASGDPDVDIGP